jgi:ABC-type multidrug transport system ATPase subunit
VLEPKIERLLRLLGIYDDRYQTLASYSKGMRQKILIAAAVLHDPRWSSSTNRSRVSTSAPRAC